MSGGEHSELFRMKKIGRSAAGMAEREALVATYPLYWTDADLASHLGTTRGIIYAIRWAIRHP